MFRRVKNWLRRRSRRKQIDALLPDQPAPRTSSHRSIHVQQAASHLRDGITDIRFSYKTELGEALTGLTDNLLAVIDVWEHQQRTQPTAETGEYHA